MYKLNPAVGNQGSTSVEAMLVLPLFLFSMLAFIYICNMLAVKSIIYEAAIQTAEYMAEYAYLAEQYPEEADCGNDIIADLKFQEYLDDGEKVEQFVINGISGVSFYGSAFPDEEGYIVLHVRYDLSVNIPFICNFSEACEERIRQKAYLGYRNSSEADGVTEDDKYVYIAENGTVYHSGRSCSYLAPEIYAASRESAVGKGYLSCEYCGASAGSTVYVTQEGERYHSVYTCSRIRRTVYRKKLNEVGGMPQCQRCY